MDHTKYRPVSDTSVGITSALALAQGDVQGIVERETEAKRVRDEGLLTASPQELKVAEHALAAARGDVERLNAIIEQLAHRRGQVIENEAVARINELAQRRSEANERMSAFARDHGKKLADLIEQGTALHQASQAIAVSLRQSQMHIFEHHRVRADEAAIPDVKPPSAAAQNLGQFFEAISNSFAIGLLAEIGNPEANDDAAPIAPAPGKRGPIAAARRMIGAEG